MDTEYQVKEPQTEEEWKLYYHLRHKILMKPWNQPEGVEKDDKEKIGIHRMIVDKDSNVVAVARLHFNSEKEAQIQYVAVDESCRRLGLGSKIVAHLEEIAKERKAEEVMLNSREVAVPMYLKLGYEIIKESYVMFNEVKHKEMRKLLVAKCV